MHVALLLVALELAPLTAHAGAPAACRVALGYQVRLDRIGFSPGEIDGLFGRSTRAAIRDLAATNWDAAQVARLVHEGTAVTFR